MRPATNLGAACRDSRPGVVTAPADKAIRASRATVPAAKHPTGSSKHSAVTAHQGDTIDIRAQPRFGRMARKLHFARPDDAGDRFSPARLVIRSIALPVDEAIGLPTEPDEHLCLQAEGLPPGMSPRDRHVEDTIGIVRRGKQSQSAMSAPDRVWPGIPWRGSFRNRCMYAVRPSRPDRVVAGRMVEGSGLHGRRGRRLSLYSGQRSKSLGSVLMPMYSHA